MSELDICNFALSSLGLEDIATLGTATAEERACSKFYPHIRDVYLQEHDWSFASKTIELVEVDPLPDGYERFQKGYEYPSDCLKARNIRDGESNYVYRFIIKDYAIAGPSDAKIILTNLPDAFLEYTVALTDTDLFNSVFTNALSKKLAFEISWQLTKDRKIQKQAYDQFLLADDAAKQHDSSEQMPEEIPLTWQEAQSSCLPGYSHRSCWY